MRLTVMRSVKDVEAQLAVVEPTRNTTLSA
jgi:hypothetical protein